MVAVFFNKVLAIYRLQGFPYKFPKYLATTYSEMQRSGIERSDKGAKQIILQEVNCLILKE